MTELAEHLSNIPLIEEIDALKKEVDAHRPFPKEIQNRIFQQFRLWWNYHSNAIEGNPYTYGETVAFIMEGITAKGKTLKDHLDIKGHNDAINFIVELVKSERALSEVDIKNLHKIILVESYKSAATSPEGIPTTKKITLVNYKTTPNHVKTATGEIHHYASVEDTPILMQELVDWYNEAKDNPRIHPLVVATIFHHKFVEIHPFGDGNGRMTRMLMNFMLMKEQYPPIVVRQEDRLNYYGVLRQADVGEYLPIVEYMGNILKDALDIQLKGIRGEDIAEKSDLDKEIALLKLELPLQSEFQEIKTIENVTNIIIDLILGLLKELRKKSETLNDIFLENEDRIIIQNQTQKFQLDSALINYSPSRIRKALETNPIKITELQELRYEYRWNYFRNQQNPFDIAYILKVQFHEFHYEILINDKLSSKKFYPTKIANDEIDTLINEQIRVVLKNIKNNTT